MVTRDALTQRSRADSSIGPDSVTNTVQLYAASGCATGVVSYVADGTVCRVEYTWTDDYRLSGVSVDGAAVAEYAYDVLDIWGDTLMTFAFLAEIPLVCADNQ